MSIRAKGVGGYAVRAAAIAWRFKVGHGLANRSLRRYVELTRAVDRGQGVCVIVGHADAEADAERIGRELDPIAETLMIQPLGPVVGAHAGPGVVGVGCYPAELLPLGIKPASSAPTRA